MTQPKPLISIVIPTYNYSSELPRAVASVCRQLKEASAELIVVDDGSTDDTPAVIDSLCLAHPNMLKAIRKPNGGPSSARNKGLLESQGSYLIFLDADDELTPHALSELSKHLESHPETRMVIGGHYSVSENGKQREHLPQNLPDQAFSRLKSYLVDKQFALSNGACALHREVFSRGNYPERLRSAEDIPVFCQALANFPCSVLHRPLAIIHKHDDSLRHQFTHAKNGGLSLIDEIFSSQRVGKEFHALKDLFYVQRCLSLFRSAYIAQETDLAKEYFLKALNKDWRVLLKSSYSRKALRLWLGLRI